MKNFRSNSEKSEEKSEIENIFLEEIRRTNVLNINFESFLEYKFKNLKF